MSSLYKYWRSALAKKLNEEEISAMIGGLFSCESPATDPWGKSVFKVFNAKSFDDILGVTKLEDLFWSSNTEN